MGLETATSIAMLNSNWPLGTDPRSQGDDHLRLIKSVLKSDVVSKKGGGTFDDDVVFGEVDGGSATAQGISAGANGSLIVQEEAAASGTSPMFRGYYGTEDVWRLQADARFYLYGGVMQITGEDGAFLELAANEAVMGASSAGASSRGVRAARSSQAGSLQVFAMGTAGSSTPTFQTFLGADQVVRFQASGSALNINGVWGTISDERLKSDIEDAGPQLPDLLALRVRNFTMNATGQRQIGFVAQELQAVKPGLVEEDEDGLLMIKTTVLIPALVGAIQELAARVSALEGAA